MTTNVTIVTHDWPAEITTIDIYNGKSTYTVKEVEPNSTETYCITNTRSLLFKELPLDVSK